MQMKDFAANMWRVIFIEIMQVGISVAIMQEVFSAKHYAHDYFYCNYAYDCFLCSHVCEFQVATLYSFLRYPFFIKLIRKHLKALCQVSISPPL